MHGSRRRIRPKIRHPPPPPGGRARAFAEDETCHNPTRWLSLFPYRLWPNPESHICKRYAQKNTPSPKTGAFLIFPPLNFIYIINCKRFQTMSGIDTDRIQNQLCFHFNTLLMANQVQTAAYLSQIMRPWYPSHMRPTETNASLRVCAVSPEPSLLPHTEYGSRRRVRPVWRMILRRIKSTTIPRHGSFVL